MKKIQIVYIKTCCRLAIILAALIILLISVPAIYAEVSPPPTPKSSPSVKKTPEQETTATAELNETETPQPTIEVPFVQESIDFFNQMKNRYGIVIAVIVIIILSIIYFVMYILINNFLQIWDSIWKKIGRRSHPKEFTLERDNTLSKEEKKKLIDLEIGLLEISPPVMLQVPKKDKTFGRAFEDVKKFDNLKQIFSLENTEITEPIKAFVLLGEPGAGKTYLLRKLRDDLKDDKRFKPLLINLRNYRNDKRIDDSENPAEKFIQQVWESYYHESIYSDNKSKNNGEKLLLADGLNEIPRENRADLLGWLWGFFDKFTKPGNRIIVSCREADYDQLQLGYPRLYVYPMDDGRIKKFLQKYIPPYAKSIWKILKDERYKDFYKLAANPFWLDKIVEVSRRGKLPANRGGIAKRFVEMRLLTDFNQDNDQRLLGKGQEAFKDALSDLAWKGLPKGDNYVFDLSDAKKILRECAGAFWSPIDDLIDAAISCGILMKDADTITFQHQLFQEFFAARRLVQQFRERKSLEKYWQIPWKEWKDITKTYEPLPSPPTTGWEEVTVMAAGLLDTTYAERFIRKILKQNSPLAARCFVESGNWFSPEIEKEIQKILLEQTLASAGGFDNLEEIDSALIPRMQLSLRIAAGEALGQINDPRIIARVENGKRVPVLTGEKVKFIEPDWVPIPEGIFQMGTSPEDVAELQKYGIDISNTAFDDEKGKHSVKLSAFKIGRYAVTVAEYQQFIDAKGYQKDKYWDWDEDAVRWLKKKPDYEKTGWFRVYVEDTEVREWWERSERERRSDSGRALRPYFWEDTRWNHPNQPVVGVTWYEAKAYAHWLTDVLREAGRLGSDEEIRLPTEAEWERSARGTDGRLWPWGNEWKLEYCNTRESRIWKTTPVGMFQDRSSPEGLLDMAGNIWEWCGDGYDPEIYKKRIGEIVENPRVPVNGKDPVLRGGSWFSPRFRARCAYRFRGVPDHSIGYIGFRLVRAPK